MLGLPKLLKEEDVQTEYPSDTDDEYITEKGFQPTLPGEYTRLSSALALFRVSRIWRESWKRTTLPWPIMNCPFLQQMGNFEAELDDWYQDLPVHLRLTFSQDKPSTDITSSRSPLLALAFYHVRALIHRPAVGSSLGGKAAPALLSIADSSKRIIQIVQLLEERSMSFSFCLNKFDLLALCGLTLLYQVVELKKDSKLTRDLERLVNVAIKTLNDAKAPDCVDLARIAGNLITVEEAQHPTHSLQGSMSMSMPTSSQRPSSKGSRKKTETCRQQDRVRRMTLPNIKPTSESYPRPRQCFDSVDSEPSGTRQGRGMSVLRMGNGTQRSCASRAIPNLDYLSLNNTPCHTVPSSPAAMTRTQTPVSSISPSVQMTCGGACTCKMPGVSPARYGRHYSAPWMAAFTIFMMRSMAAPASSMGRQCKHFLPSPDWSPDSWDLHGENSMGNFGRSMATALHSVLNLSDEGLSSGEEVAPSDLRHSVGSADLSKASDAGSFRI